MNVKISLDPDFTKGFFVQLCEQGLNKPLPLEGGGWGWG